MNRSGGSCRHFQRSSSGMDIPTYAIAPTMGPSAVKAPPVESMAPSWLTRVGVPVPQLWGSMSDLLYALLSIILHILVGESDGVSLCSHKSNEGGKDRKRTGKLHDEG